MMRRDEPGLWLDSARARRPRRDTVGRGLHDDAGMVIMTEMRRRRAAA